MQIIIAIIIHLIVPIIGIIFFIDLIRKMRFEKIENPPIIDWFLIFATYGGLLLVVLTTLFWKWSGMASIGTLYLIIVAPVIMGIISYLNYKKKSISKYHNWVYKISISYFIIAPIIIFILIYSIMKYENI